MLVRLHELDVERGHDGGLGSENHKSGRYIGRIGRGDGVVGRAGDDGCDGCDELGVGDGVCWQWVDHFESGFWRGDADWRGVW